MFLKNRKQWWKTVRKIVRKNNEENTWETILMKNGEKKQRWKTKTKKSEAQMTISDDQQWWKTVRKTSEAKQWGETCENKHWGNTVRKHREEKLWWKIVRKTMNRTDTNKRTYRVFTWISWIFSIPIYILKKFGYPANLKGVLPPRIYCIAEFKSRKIQDLLLLKAKIWIYCF